MTERRLDLAATALAPMIWGSTYVVTTQWLPSGHPLGIALLRALPAGLLLLALTRQLPKGIWWSRVLILGTLNFGLFWALLFVSAYRLPGGVAATLGAIQPLIVMALARYVLGTPVRLLAIAAALVGMAGVALLVLTPRASLDGIGVAAGLIGAVSMALGTVLTRHWQPDVSNLAFTAWQLVAGGLVLVPVVLLFEPGIPLPDLKAVAGIAYLGLIGAAFTYWLWFRGIGRLAPSLVAILGALSPLVATLLGWIVLDQSLSLMQIAGMALIFASVVIARKATQPARPA
jgi:probable blue pigment (indigoidine) exporter